MCKSVEHKVSEADCKPCDLDFSTGQPRVTKNVSGRRGMSGIMFFIYLQKTGEETQVFVGGCNHAHFYQNNTSTYLTCSLALIASFTHKLNRYMSSAVGALALRCSGSSFATVRILQSQEGVRTNPSNPPCICY